VDEAIQTAGLPVELHVEPDGERALDFLMRAERDPNAPRPHLVLLDLNLPKIDGLAVLRWLRERDEWKTLPVMIITSSDAPEDRGGAATFASGYFRKPANYEAFLRLGPVLKQFLEENGLLQGE